MKSFNAVLPILAFLVICTNAQAISKAPLVDNLFHMGPLYDAILPSSPTFVFHEWHNPTQHHPNTANWNTVLFDKTSPDYCGDNLTLYNVTYSDCPSPWLFGYCKDGIESAETVMLEFGRIYSNMRAAVSDLLYKGGTHTVGNDGSSGTLSGILTGTDMVEVAVRAMIEPIQYHKSVTWMTAVNQDSCVVDKESAHDLNQATPDYHTALLRAGILVAYEYLAGKPGATPNNTGAACMQNQINVIKAKWADTSESVDDARFTYGDDPACHDKIEPTLQTPAVLTSIVKSTTVIVWNPPTPTPAPVFVTSVIKSTTVIIWTGPPAATTS